MRINEDSGFNENFDAHEKNIKSREKSLRRLHSISFEEARLIEAVVIKFTSILDK